MKVIKHVRGVVMVNYQKTTLNAIAYLKRHINVYFIHINIIALPVLVI